MTQLLTLAKVEVSSAASPGRIVNFETGKKRFMSTFDMFHDMFVYQTGPTLQEFMGKRSGYLEQSPSTACLAGPLVTPQ
jgi:hypothetical protein